MRKKIKPSKQKAPKAHGPPAPKRKPGRPPKEKAEGGELSSPPAKKQRKKNIKNEVDVHGEVEEESEMDAANTSTRTSNLPAMECEDMPSEGIHMSTMQVKALSALVACKECGEEIHLGVRPTTKGMINEFTVTCKVCSSHKSTNTPNLIRERKRKREKKGIVLQKTENINYAHVASFLDNGLGYSGLKHYCKYLNARCLNEATFICYARQVIADVVQEAEEFLQQNARIVRKAFETQLESDHLVDLTVSYTTTYHQWGSDFCLVAGAVIELQTGLVLDYDVANMYCHVCKINAKRIVNMTPAEMTEWFNKHQDTCEIREWCDEIDQDAEEGVKEIDPKYLESFIAKKLWSRSVEKFGFRYTTLIHESDEKIHEELLKAAPYDDIPVLVDTVTNCFSRRKSEHARTSFQNKLKSKCPRERVQTKDRIMYVYSMSIPEYNKFAIGSNIKLRELVRKMEEEEQEMADLIPQIHDTRDVAEDGEEVEELEGNEVYLNQTELLENFEGGEEERAALITELNQIQAMEEEEEEIVGNGTEETEASETNVGEESEGSEVPKLRKPKLEPEHTQEEEHLEENDVDEFLPRRGRSKSPAGRSESAGSRSTSPAVRSKSPGGRKSPRSPRRIVENGIEEESGEPAVLN